MAHTGNGSGRRTFLKAMTAAAAAPLAAQAADPPSPSSAAAPGPVDRAWMAAPVQGLYRVEMDIQDCELDGRIPTDLAGAFYRVGPDPQYPMMKGNIPFDGEGHASMFRIANGRVNYKSRFVKNERYLANARAGRELFPMYRNPFMDDPAAKGISRSTANTHIINYRDMLLAMKEDSPPTALDLLTLETKVPNYTFGGTLPSRTFTAHPKIDSASGNLVSFGYEADGHATNAISIFEYSPKGKLLWKAKISAPYICALHDFAVTSNFISFFLMPLNIDEQQMARGGVHWSWDGTQPSWFGYLRRGGDGKDVQWIKGPTRGMFHVMGNFDDGKMLYVDMALAKSNIVSFMPQRDGSPFDPIGALTYTTRVSVDTSRSSPRDYKEERLYPHTSTLPRQDDRYQTVPYRYGYLPCPDPASGNPLDNNNCLARFDHQTREVRLYNGGPGAVMSEFVFAPRSAKAGEGVGYLVGVVTRLDRGGARELLVFDAEHPQDGPLATVHLPVPIVGQVHGWWVPEWQLPRSRAQA
jgi:carotenoid cleavage dioxygenase